MALPISFCVSAYKKNNADLLGLSDDEATLHYLIHGHKENRSYKETRKKNVLYFSPQWPYYDKNSGGKRTLEIFKVLSELCNVYYFVNEESNEKYEKELKKLGIKYFYRGTNVKEKLMQLKSKNINFDFSFFSWWESGAWYLKTVESIFPDIKKIADSVDVHWLREERGGFSDAARKNAEISVYKSCDVVLAVTHEDRIEIEKECGIKNVRVLSNIHKEETKEHLGGKDIIFLGGFNHTPNVIAAIRAYDIYQKFIKESKEDCSLYIVGDNPNKEIKSLHDGEKVFVTGFVEDIKPYLEKSKVMIAPLTWGAGIKGKVCEAIMHKIPVLTTKIGAEGFGFSNFDDCFIAETDREFVGCLKKIYALNQDAIKETTNKAFKKTKNLVSKKSALSMIDSIVGESKNVVVSIVTYRNQEILEECLNSIENNTEYKNTKIVVSDNAREKIVESLVQKFRFKKMDIEYVSYEKNEFFSRPHNNVMNRFKRSDVILLNDDTVIKTKCWITELQRAAYLSGDIACCGGKSLLPNGNLEEAGSIIFNNGYGINLGRDQNPEKEEYNKRRFVGYCSASLLYMRRDAINEIGVLDEDFKPLYYEDTDWQYRAHLAGLRILYEPGCVYTHKGRSTTRGKLNDYMDICREIFKNKYKDHDLEAYNDRSKWSI